MIPPEAVWSLRRGADLDSSQAAEIMRHMLSGGGTDRDNADVLGLLADKGETDEEILGMLGVMEEFMVTVDLGADAIDMCGTGGDGMGTFNVSTTASFVAAAAGALVAKHGNRSSSGGFGSADVFRHLGCDIDAGPRRIAELARRHRICFLFAQRYHPAARRVAGARKLLGRRSVFNVLGPLCNPAGVRRQLVGVSDMGMLERMPGMMGRRGSRCAMSVMSGDGMDEFSASSVNHVAVYRDGETSRMSVRPEDLGIRRADTADLLVGAGRRALEAFVHTIRGTAGRPMVDTAALNAAAGLVVAGRADGLEDGFGTALEAIESGRAASVLEGFVRDAGDASVLEGIM